MRWRRPPVLEYGRQEPCPVLVIFLRGGGLCAGRQNDTFGRLGWQDRRRVCYATSWLSMRRLPLREMADGPGVGLPNLFWTRLGAQFAIMSRNTGTRHRPPWQYLKISYWTGWRRSGQRIQSPNGDGTRSAYLPLTQRISWWDAGKVRAETPPTRQQGWGSTHLAMGRREGRGQLGWELHPLVWPLIDRDRWPGAHRFAPGSVLGCRVWRCSLATRLGRSCPQPLVLDPDRL